MNTLSMAIAIMMFLPTWIAVAQNPTVHDLVRNDWRRGAWARDDWMREDWARESVARGTELERSATPVSSSSRQGCSMEILPYSYLRRTDRRVGRPMTQTVVGVTSQQTVVGVPPQTTGDVPSFLSFERAGGGQLHYFGVRHTRDPNHPQFEQIEQSFAAIQPTLVFYEGPARSLPTTKTAAIQIAGDPGLIRYLAHQHSIPAAQLEPHRKTEIDQVLQQFTPEQVKLFYVLRQMVELRDVWRSSSETQFRRAAQRSLEQLSTYEGLQTIMMDLEEFETSYRQYWPAAPEWWNAPRNWFNPVLTVDETGGVFTNDLHRVASTFRNHHMVKVLSEAVHQGHRVMAVVGKGHLPLQAPALECLLQ